MTAGDGLAVLTRDTCGSSDVTVRCVGYVRNVVPTPDADYPHPVPWAHVPVFVPTEQVKPVIDGSWLSLESARPELSIRHWWPIVQHTLNPSWPTP